MKDLKKFLTTATGVSVSGVNFGIVEPSGRRLPASVEEVWAKGGGLLTVRASYGGGFTDELLLRSEGGGVVCERRVKNVSGKTLPLTEAFLTLTFPSFGGNPSEDYFYHVENPRVYDRLSIPLDTVRGPEMVNESDYDMLAGNKWIDAYDACERIGYSPYQPFPAILVSNNSSGKGLVHGTLSQKVFFHNYIAKHAGAATRLEVFSSFKAVEYREVRPGEALEDKWWVGVTEDAGDIEKIFSGYVRVLKKHIGPLYGATDINRLSCVWGSWNDGIFRDIDEARLVKMAEHIARELPTVEWMQVDDGYAKLAGRPHAHGLGAPYEKNGGTDMDKFPGNLCSFTEKARAAGVRPAIWIGGMVPGGTPVRNERPEWFADYSFRPCLRDIPAETRPLPFDVSKPEVREFMCRAIDFLLVESGFVGMKHDFWSYPFEDSRLRLANKDKSGYEWRAWWLQEIRKRIPDDGYLQTGCDIVMANPFLAQYFTNYRYGIDIGSGSWENVVTNFLWGAACFALHIGDMFVPNSDSIGLFPGLSDTEALFCVNYCLISRSMVEVAGWLCDEESHPRMKWVKKAVCCPNNGQDVFFANYDYRASTSKSPDVWYLKSPHFSLLEGDPLLPSRTFAVFNLGDKEKEFSVRLSDLGLPAKKHVVTDVWSLESQPVGDVFKITLKGRSSALFGVSPDTKTPSLLDANLKVVSAAGSDSSLRLELAYPGRLEAVVNFKPGRVLDSSGNAVDAVVKKGAGNWVVECDVTDAVELRA